MADKQVTVYALSTCIHCKHTKEYLDSMGITYACIHVDQLTGDERKDAVEQVKKYNPSASFPTVVIDEDCVVVGYKKDELKKHLG
ncbi:glutaredoxin family protein [Desulfovibrio ferrophilus]|uniref:Glutaredoxin n=1 Tax=Desulfovibrio ferrophilus TaxID=241368 RepID=A0A2Z6B0H3_9BACT|nr:glutaredoxin family protein [Desulfovibrio ferrophilus]BBD08930.1 glutaredoxin [Desulfovibrio ferrophilus]